MTSCRRFIITSNAPRAQTGPAGIVYASTPHKAADLFARRFTGYACHPLRQLPAREDEAGALWSNWRAEVAHLGDVPERVPAVLFIREQIGGFGNQDARLDLMVFDESSATL